MLTDIIPMLQCPYCAQPLTVYKIIEREGGNITCGLLRCPCDIYPIIDSILILKKPDNRLAVTNSNKHIAFNVQPLFNMQKGYNSLLRLLYPGSLLSRFADFTLKTSVFDFLGIRGLLKLLSLFPKSRSFAQYLLTLPNNPESRVPSFLLKNLPHSPKIVIDVGCGITPYAAGRDFAHIPVLIGLDSNFTLLYLSQYFYKNPSQSFIYADLSHGFPFRGKVADLVFSLNCFTYLFHQQQTLKSIIRTAKKHGSIFLGDMIPSLKKQRLYWYPRSPSFYTSQIFTHFEIINYDKLLCSITNNLPLTPRSLSYNSNSQNRFGIYLQLKR